MATTQQFESATATVARTFSRDDKISVVFKGEKAATTKGMIMLPKLPDGAEISPVLMAAGRGYVDHEVGHQLMTPFTKESVEGLSAWGKFLLNAMEDMRIERGMTQMYPSMRDNFDATARVVNTRLLKQFEEDPESFGTMRAALPLAVTMAGRALMKYGMNGRDVFVKLPEDVREKALELAKFALTVPTGVIGTSVNRRSAHNHFKKLVAKALAVDAELKEAEKEEEEAKPAPTHVIPAGEPEHGREIEGEAGEEEDGGGAPGGSSGELPETEGEASTTEKTYKVIDFETSQAIEAMKEQAQSTGAVSHDVYKLVRTDFDVRFDRDMAKNRLTYQKVMESGTWAEIYASRMNLSCGMAIYAETRDRMQADMMMMKRRVERALLSQMTAHWAGGHTSGQRIDLRRVGEVVGFSKAQYKRKIEVTEMNTAVTLLVDLSGSMFRGEKVRMATQATIAMAEILELAGVPCEVLGFHNPITDFNRMYWSNRGDTLDGMMKDAARRGASRWTPLVMPVFKRWSDTLRASKNALGNIKHLVGGSNADADAILKAWDGLRQRPESRKILMVISDGLPAIEGQGDSRALRRATVAAVKHVTAQGCECVGLGLEDSSVQQFYPRNVVILDAADFGKAMVDQIGKLLLGEGFDARRKVA